jgi:hypothetical protein
MFPWTDQDVARRLRLDVLEGKHLVVFVDDFRRDFFSPNFAEQAVGHEDYPELKVYS